MNKKNFFRATLLKKKNKKKILTRFHTLNVKKSCEHIFFSEETRVTRSVDEEIKSVNNFFCNECLVGGKKKIMRN